MGRADYTRRDFLKAVGLGTASLAVAGCTSAGGPLLHKTSTERPNTILIMADDLGYGDLGCYGNGTIETPNLDTLAKSGLWFTDFHANAPMCSPTRAALLTGRYQQRCGIEGVLSGKSNHDTGMGPEEVTFAEVLKSAGYATAVFGKWHLGYTAPFSPVEQGFGTFRGFLWGGLDYHSHINRSGLPDWWKDNELVPEEGYTTDLITEHAIRFIEQNRDTPFCLYLPYQAVHFPWQGPKDKADRVVGGDYWSALKYGSRKDRRAAYKEMVESLDAGIGRIVSAVKRLGIENKTLIFFTSDNGAYTSVGSNGPLTGQKGQLWEGGHRVPAIAYWPGKIRPGTVNRDTVMTMDLFPTMAAMAGANLPSDLKLDGVNLLPMLTKGKKLPERTLFWRHKKEWAVRKGPWKLLVKGENQHLFNLARDISEQNDLARSQPEMVKAMQSEFLTWEKEVCAGVTWIRK